MEIERCAIEGLFTIKPNIFQDDRGYFFESFNSEKFQNETGIEVNFVQDNESMSSYGTLRGLHFQKPPFDQAKLVRVITGEILDVVVDLRASSPTIGMHHKTILSDKNKNQLYIPKGFAHGFLVKSDIAIFAYKVDNYYSSQSDSGIVWNDKKLNINWEMNLDEILLSQKDQNLQDFTSYQTNPDF